MSALGHKPFITPEEYLAGERISPFKNEYIDGRLYAMSGATDAHDTITGNIFAMLHEHARHRGCRTYSSDMKVRIEPVNRFYYPDVQVTCDDRDRNPADFKRFPRVIVEVLSRSTEAFDRGDKFQDYLKIETLEEYVLISQEQMSVEVRRPTDGKHWISEALLPGDTLVLESLDFRCPVEALYEEVIWEEVEAESSGADSASRSS